MAATSATGRTTKEEEEAPTASSRLPTVGDKMDMPARDRAGTRNRGNVHDCRGTASPGEITLFVLPNPIQVIKQLRQ